jgi:alpha-ketoglutarate-dependent taurine dioxygenase
MPLLVRPERDTSSEALVDWIGDNHNYLRRAMTLHGAVLFRGFSIYDARAFERVASAIDPELKDRYLGTSPRKGLTEKVFSASELPGHYPIPQHCEMTFIAEPPRRLFFCCLVEPRHGGETPLADFRRVYRDLDPRVRDRFIERGVRIIRNYDGPGAGKRLDPWKLKRWDEMFGTTDRSEVEAECRRQGFAFDWLPGGRLRLVSHQPAVRNHPESGEPTWFTHLQVFHLGSAPAEYRRIYARTGEARIWALTQLSSAMVAVKRRLKSPEDHALHCTYRDGTEIPEADIEHVRDVIWKHMVAIPWRRGDVVAIDNHAVSHGRLPYRGDREIVVAWS